MHSTTIDELADQLILRAGFNAITDCHTLHRRDLSGVDRLHVYDEHGARTVIFKYAAAPLTTTEAATLQWLAHHQLPVPHLLASEHLGSALGLLLQDLGDPIREPTLTDAARAAVVAHRAPPVAGTAVLDTARLADLPARCNRLLRQLQDAGRWTAATDVADQLGALEEVAHQRAAGAELAPWGTCHSGFHPTSLHIGAHGWRLLDWARTFTGPGLLDLASWQGTRQPPDVDALDTLIDAYAAAGGDERVAFTRAGLPPARWALGWHRVWIIDWYLEQCTTWVADLSRDKDYQHAVRRHLAEALHFLS